MQLVDDLRRELPERLVGRAGFGDHVGDAADAFDRAGRAWRRGACNAGHDPRLLLFHISTNRRSAPTAPAGFASGKRTPASCRWQAAQWPGRTSRSAGASLRQRASHRGSAAWKWQPGGRIDRARHVAGQDHPLAAPCAAPSGSARPRAAPRCRGAAASRTALRLSVSLDDAAEIHHRHAVADVLDHREVVRDEQVGEPELVLQVHQQVDDLRLDRHVERRDRLVADDQLRARAPARGRCRCAGAGRRRTRAESGRSCSGCSPTRSNRGRHPLAALLGACRRRG